MIEAIFEESFAMPEAIDRGSRDLLPFGLVDGIEKLRIVNLPPNTKVERFRIRHHEFATVFLSSAATPKGEPEEWFIEYTDGQKAALKILWPFRRKRTYPIKAPVTKPDAGT